MHLVSLRCGDGNGKVCREAGITRPDLRKKLAAAEANYNIYGRSSTKTLAGKGE